MRNTIRLIPVLMLACFLVGCAAFTGMNESEKALTITTQYQDVVQTYKNQYRASGEENRKLLRENVAPKLDRARNLLIEYNKAFILDKPVGERRVQILNLIRRASLEMMEVKDE